LILDEERKLGDTLEWTTLIDKRSLDQMHSIERRYDTLQSAMQNLVSRAVRIIFRTS